MDKMDRNLLSLMSWLLFLGGIFGFAMGLQKSFTAASPAEYGVMGIGGGLWFLFSAITIYIKNKV